MARPSEFLEPNIGRVERGLSLFTGALLLAASRSRGRGGVPLALSGAYLLARGATGHCFLYQALDVDAAGVGPAAVVPLRASVTIDRPVEEVYAFWRDFANLPRFMRHLESVEVMGHRSRWRAVTPGGMHLEWEADLVEDRENEVIGWCSVEGSPINHKGGVRFHRAPGNRGTEVRVRIMLTPGSGAVAAGERLVRGVTEAMIQDDMRRLKQLLEAGEIATVEGQSSARWRPQRGEVGVERGPEVTP